MSTEGERLAGVVLASAKVPGLVAHGIRALINGLWLGVLSEPTLRALDSRYYSQTDLYRTPLWNERGLFDWERRAVEGHFPAGGRVLVPACGGGREVLALLEAGFDAVGFEPHPELAAYAEEFLAERGHPGRAERGEPDRFPAGAGPCDGVVLGWGAYSLVRGTDARVRFLSEARAHLPRGGPVLLSFFDQTGLGRQLRWTAAVANALRRLRRARALEPGDTLGPNFVHVFARDELEGEAADAGFEVSHYAVPGVADGGTRYACAVLIAR